MLAMRRAVGRGDCVVTHNAPHERAAEGRPLDAVVGRHYTGDDK